MVLRITLIVPVLGEIDFWRLYSIACCYTECADSYVEFVAVMQLCNSDIFYSSLIFSQRRLKLFFIVLGAPVAQWVKRRPTDLAD